MPGSSNNDTKEMIERLKSTNKKANRLILSPYVVMCPREKCKSKILYLQGSYLVYKGPKKNKLLNVVYPDFEQNSSEDPQSKSTFQKPKIPLDVLSAIEAKKGIFLGSSSLQEEKPNSSQQIEQNNKDSKTNPEDKIVNLKEKTNSDDNRSSDAEGFFWCVSDVFKFENIGMSKPVEGDLRYLICADCDCGPLGYHDPKSVQVQYLKPEKGDSIEGKAQHDSILHSSTSNKSSSREGQQLIKSSTPVLEYLLAVDKVRYQKL
ncbi:putative guanine nucleotide exchange factor MSS4-like protein [Smittium mucronatum]|uniref:Putative guanine nucleotide exchange factor MSS4-like protein n=1 Tax=Smittium mucronatum TaxID=133383 RepID=A0A1R0GML5_9FUNG|nr:putative guanine nucleotide exchange factor MSS4-like protein [Smittium mucronatum]